jgi:GDP-L-fucose synthase
MGRADADLRRQDETERLFDKFRPEYVFLAAAKVGGIVANNTYKAEFIYDNLAIALNVINSSFQFGVTKLLNLGSSCIYPKFAPQPLKEEYLLTGQLEPTNEPYAIAKIAAIKLCRYYNEQYGTNYISVMPTNLYGPNDNFNLETSHVLPALIRKFILAKKLSEKDFDYIKFDLSRYKLGFGLDKIMEMSEVLNDINIQSLLEKVGITKDSVTIWGTGNVRREFMYVDDLADACVYLMGNKDSGDVGEFVNIGSGEDVSIRELAELIKEIVEFTGEIIYNTLKPEGTPRKLLDVSRMNELGWKYKIKLEEGIRKVIKEY